MVASVAIYPEKTHENTTAMSYTEGYIFMMWKEQNFDFVQTIFLANFSYVFNPLLLWNELFKHSLNLSAVS